MKLPRIIFRRSFLYDRNLYRSSNFKFPEEKILANHLRKLKRDWDKVEGKVLREISSILGLKWHEKEIVVYLTAGVSPFSDPVTLGLKSDVHTLTHELIHRLLSEEENWPIIKKAWKNFLRKYTKETPSTKVHIMVHAVHGLLIEKLFSSKILEKEKKVTVHLEEYNRAWEIAESEGYKNVVQNFRREFQLL